MDAARLLLIDWFLQGDTNPFIAQYLAERESLLAESLDHKRKVQAGILFRSLLNCHRMTCS